MHVKLEFSEEELKSIVSPIDNAPIDGYGRIDKNRNMYTLPIKKLANTIAAKVSNSLEEVNKEIQPVLLRTMGFSGVTVEEFTAREDGKYTFTGYDGHHSIGVELFSIPPVVGDKFFGTTVLKPSGAKPSIATFTAKVTAITNNKVEYVLEDATILHNGAIDKQVEDNTNAIPLVVNGVLELNVSYDKLVPGYKNSIGVKYLNKIPNKDEKFVGLCKDSENDVLSFVAKITDNVNDSGFAPFVFTSVTLLHNGTIDEVANTKLGADVALSLNEKDYKLTLELKNLAEEVIGSSTVDLPLEEMIVNGEYDSENKAIVLTLKNGNMVAIPVGDIVNGLVQQRDESFFVYGRGYSPNDTAISTDRVLGSLTTYGDIPKRLANNGLFVPTDSVTEEKSVINKEYGDTNYVPSTEKGQPNGVASLGEDGKVPVEQLPAGQGGIDPTEYVKFTDYATANKAGVSKINGKGFSISEDGELQLYQASRFDIDKKASLYNPITPFRLDYAVKVGVTTNTETLTDEEKTSACEWLGAVAIGEPNGSYVLVYAQRTDGTIAKYILSDRLVSNSIPIRTSATKNFWVGTPQEDNECVNKAYVDGNFVANSKVSANEAKAWTLPQRTYNGRVLVGTPEGSYDAVNLAYFDENAGTKWYKHVMSQVVENMGTFDLLIVSTRATNYTSGQEIIDDWKDRKISSFFDSSADATMAIKITGISGTNPFCIKMTGGSIGYGLGYQLDSGTFSYRETIQKL